MLLLCVDVRVCVCAYIHMCTMIGMKNAEELAQDAVSGRRGKLCMCVTWCRMTCVCVCVCVCVNMLH